MQTHPQKTETTLSEVFSWFTSKDKNRPDLQKPFELNGKVYATNGDILMRTGKENVDFDVEQHIILPAAENIFPDGEENKPITISKAALEIYKTEDEVEEIGNNRECKDCNGAGEVIWVFQQYEMKEYCPVCNGCGYEETKQQRKTGRKTFSPHHLVKIRNTYFSIENIYRLTLLQEYTRGEPIILRKLEIRDPSLFQVGIFEILIAPMYPHNLTDDHNVLEIKT